jgi:broad specificity phosphatase PhoE
MSAWLWAAAGILLARTAFADDSQLVALSPALQRGGYVIVVRHGATDPRQSDVYPLNYDDMTRQRQLSEHGREIAREMGTGLNALQIPIGKVYTSRLNRAQETGRLIAGKDVTWKIELNDSSMGSTSAMTGSAVTGNLRSAAALRQLVNARPDPGTNTLVVTHKTNIQDAFGKAWADIREGESLLFRPDGSDGHEPLARIPANDWIALARGR